MEMTSRISKGSKMDQIYLPKNRSGFGVGDYVIIKPIEKQEIAEKPYFYNIKYIEPVKLKIIEEIFTVIERNAREYDNVIITGSFLERGFAFNDIDLILVSAQKQDVEKIQNATEDLTGITTHIILIDNKSLLTGLSTDPIYQNMVNNCIAKKRLIYKIQPKINYKLLDLHLLRSKVLLDNFDFFDGNEKYYLTRNMIAINCYLRFKKIDRDRINDEINKRFNLNDVDTIKKNMLDKRSFLKKYKQVYEETFNLIMKSIKNAAK